MSFGVVSPVVFTNQIDQTATIITAGAVTTMTSSSARRNYLVGTTTHTMALPPAAGLTDISYEFINNSTGVVTITTSTLALVTTLQPSANIELVLIGSIWTQKRFLNTDSAASMSYPTAPQTEGVWYGASARQNCASTSVTIGNSCTGGATNSVAAGQGAIVGALSSDKISIGRNTGSTNSTSVYTIGTSSGSFVRTADPIVFGGSSLTGLYSGSGNIIFGQSTGNTIGLNTYAAGTASQSGTTITGSGTTWESFNRGSAALIVWTGGQQAPLTTFNSATSFTSTVSQSVSNSTYVIYYGNLYNTGTASASGTAVTGVGTTFTSVLVGGYIIFGVFPAVVARITAVNSPTNITLATSVVSAAAAYRIYYATPNNNIVFGGNPGITDGSGNVSIGYGLSLLSNGPAYNNGVIIGNTLTGGNGVTIGTNCVSAVANANPGIVIGSSSSAYGIGSGLSSIAIGPNNTGFASGAGASCISIGFANRINSGSPAPLGGIALGHGVQIGDGGVGLGVDTNGGNGVVMNRVANGGTSGTNSVVFGSGSNTSGVACIGVGRSISSGGANNLHVGISIGNATSTGTTSNSVFGFGSLQNVPAASTITNNVAMGISCLEAYSITATASNVAPVNTNCAPSSSTICGITMPAVSLTASRNVILGNNGFLFSNNSDSVMIGSTTASGASGSIRLGLQTGSMSSLIGYIGTSADGGVNISAASNVLTITAAAAINPFQIGMILHLPGMNADVTIVALLSGSLGAVSSTYTVSGTFSMNRRNLRAYGVSPADIAIGTQALSRLYTGSGQNIAIGRTAGSTITTGDNNIAIGTSAQVASGATFATAIGAVTNNVNSSAVFGANSTTLSRFEAPVVATEAGGIATAAAVCGVFVTTAAITAGSSSAFTCNCNRVRTGSVLLLTVLSPAGHCTAAITSISAGSFQFTVANLGSVSTGAPPSVHFTVKYPATV